MVIGVPTIKKVPINIPHPVVQTVPQPYPVTVVIPKPVPYEVTMRLINFNLTVKSFVILSFLVKIILCF